MQLRTITVRPSSIELEAKRIYRRTLSAWAMDYLRCRSLLRSGRGGQMAGRECWSAPPLLMSLEEE